MLTPPLGRSAPSFATCEASTGLLTGDPVTKLEAISDAGGTSW